MRHFSYFRETRIVLLLILALLFVSGIGGAQTTEPKSNQDKVARIDYKEVPLKMVIKNLASQLKLNVVFDETFRDHPKYDLELNDVTLEAALKIIFVQQRLAARLIEEKTIIVFFNNETNQMRYQEHPVWPVKPDQKR